ncbi:hypothetical protein CXB51_035157 [Gossypium anomalum]|uniref:GAG-pre-integrase domain-containing protein n=1 Tax=Gossypium anomalum TaxID=47600 RepID=A0A8J5Y4K3_9ROSI|nr:hypothetical protein CXB51_035157 [Gossypium anomalum]
MAEDQEIASSSSTNVSKNFTNKKINIQLDEINCPLWKQQVSFALESYGLESYIDGTQAIPLEFVSDDPKILPDLVMCQSTAEIWEVIGQLYSAKTTTKIINLWYSLYFQKKGDQNMRDYLRQLKLIKDNLGIYGEKISDAEHITAILNGLPSEFDSVVTLITTSRQAYDVLALSSMLIDLEARQKSGVVAGLFSVNLVTSQFTSYGAQGYQQPTEGVPDFVGYRGREEATSHLTRDAPSRTNSVPYSGAGKVTVANGQSLLISSTSQSTLLTNNKPLHMKNLIYVPGITKNLMSVSQFSNDNKMYFEFHTTKYFFKDAIFHQVLLQGVEQDGLYKLKVVNTSEFDSVMNVEKINVSVYDVGVSYDIWHRRLGHSSSDVMAQIFCSCKMNVLKNKDVTLCVVRKMGKSHKLPLLHLKTVYTMPLQFIEIDVWGPTLEYSSCFRYYVTFVDA